MNTTKANTAPTSSTASEVSSIPLTGTWFGRHGLAPYTLMGLYPPAPAAPDHEREITAA